MEWWRRIKCHECKHKYEHGHDYKYKNEHKYEG